MTYDGDPCSNCGSGSHERCCARCGKVAPVGWTRGSTDRYCSAKCRDEQARDDRRSSEIEEDYQRARLDATTVRGLRELRALAQVTLDSGISPSGYDMTDREASEFRLAIGWLDKQLSKVKS